MRNDKIKKCILICGFILALLYIFYSIVYTKFYHQITKTDKAINGSIDLTKANLSKEVVLVGQWEFYWNQLIHSEPNHYATPDFMIEVPKEWSQYKINGKHLPAHGYASYKLNLEVSYDKLLTLYIPDFASAYQIFIDGILVSKSGIVSKDTNSIFTTPKAEAYYVLLANDISHEVIIEIATTKFSGLYMAPIIGDYEHIVNVNIYRNSIKFILFGVAFSSFICLSLMCFIASRKKKQTYWMPFMILILLIRSMLTCEFYSFWQPVMFFNLSYEATNELMYLATLVLKYIFIFLLEEECGITCNKKEKMSFFIYYCFLYLLYLSTPQYIYNLYLSILIPMLSFVLEIYLYVKVYRQRQSLNKYGSAMFFGTILVIIGIAIEGFYLNGNVYMNMSLHLLFLYTICALIMCLVYALRSADCYDEYMKSFVKLEFAESQIAMQKVYYKSLSNQITEIKEIKHDMGHVIGVISQLCDEGRINCLREYLREYINKTEIERLPVFCDHTVINSLIGYYYLKAKEYGIRIEIDCGVNGVIAIGDVDLSIVLGNALDNAIYACQQMDKTNNPFIFLESKVVQGQFLLKISNTYKGIIHRRNGKYVSDRNGHGYGLCSIKKVVESYKGYIKIEDDNNVFTLMVAVPIL